MREPLNISNPPERATRRRTTIADVAEEAGVSRTTVSYVLSGRLDVRVPDATRLRITEAAEQLGYRRNALAAAFRSGRMNTVGIVAPFAMMSGEPGSRTADVYYKDLVLAVAARASESGLNALLLSEDADRQVTLNELTDRRCDAVILVVKSGTADFVDAATSNGVPCVAIGRDHGAWQVHSDNRLGARLAVEHLAELGHRRVAFLTYRTSAPVVSQRQRLEGFLESATALGIGDPEVYYWNDIAELVESVRRGDGPTAVFCYCDELAVTLRDACADANVLIPDDLSIVGYDDNVLARTMRPRLTTIHNPIGMIAKEAVRLVMAQLTDIRASVPPIYVAPWLVHGQSTSSPNPAAVSRQKELNQ